MLSHIRIWTMISNYIQRPLLICNLGVTSQKGVPKIFFFLKNPISHSACFILDMVGISFLKFYENNYVLRTSRTATVRRFCSKLFYFKMQIHFFDNNLFVTNRNNFSLQTFLNQACISQRAINKFKFIPPFYMHPCIEGKQSK